MLQHGKALSERLILTLKFKKSLPILFKMHTTECRINYKRMKYKHAFLLFLKYYFKMLYFNDGRFDSYFKKILHIIK